MRVERSILPAPTHQYDALVEWFREKVPPGASLLEVGAGPGTAVYQEHLAPLVDRWVGIDPDPSVAGNPYLTGHAVGPVEAWYPGDPPAPFDAALAVYVAEHVAHPDAFLGRIHELLVPRGSFWFLTPNLWHYFGASAYLTSRLGIEDRLLRHLRGDTLVEEYHFPVTYRLNSVPRIARAAEAAGFSRLEVRHLDHPGVFEDYFPGPLARLPSLWSAAVHRQRLGRLMGTLLVRLEA